jgi:mRNA-degrading endonuclease RelE of RelBE toxin-antitoxin system
MQQDPFSVDLVHLKGSAAAYRRRVGAYRILFTLRLYERRIDVTNIVRHTSTTY